jgi:arabinan endo-1,5-alpha-L-arabinosidase
MSSAHLFSSSTTTNEYLIENPHVKLVLDHDFADPSVFKTQNTYYAVATNTFRHTDSGYRYIRIQTAQSPDEDNWELLQEDALIQVPTWSRGINYWAPFVFQHPSGKFLMYYACETTSIGDYGIGVAISDHPIKNYRDTSKKPLVWGKRYANIDPFVYLNSYGDLSLLWGSEEMGIHQKQLTPDGLKQDRNSSRHHVLPVIKNDFYERVIEGAYIHEHHNYEYLYYSGADCFGNGENRFGEYSVLVARRKKGEIYFQRRSQTDTKQNLFFAGNHWIKNPGNASIVDSNPHEFTMFCHIINRNTQYFPYLYRKLNRRPMIKIIGQYNDNGWPEVKAS